MKESLIIKFLYKTILGRTILKGLVNPQVSKAAAKFFTSQTSRWLLPGFIRKNQIYMDRYIVPEGGFESFNDFFTRKIKCISLPAKECELISPCDGLLTVSEIDENTSFYIKHTEYSVAELLKDEKMARSYVGGTALIFRLTPAHYHRYIFCTSGRISKKKRIDGILHSVQPVCHERTKVFVQNSREFVLIESLLSSTVQMEVGALLVGKISNYELNEDDIAEQGQEKGYFEYGGSTIVILIDKKIEISNGILNRVPVGDELPVCIGEAIC